MFRLRASNFLCRQKVTKELSKGRGISISLSPLKSPLLETTNQGGFGPPIGCTPRGLAVPCKVQRKTGGAGDETRSQVRHRNAVRLTARFR